MKKPRLAKRSGTVALLTTALFLLLGGGTMALAGGFHGWGSHGGGSHGGGSHGGGFHGGGFRGGGFHGGAFRGGGFHGGGFGGFHGSPRYYGGYGLRPHGAGWGWGSSWGLGLGLYLPVLPWYYTTFWWDGVPYYDVENDYYVWDPDASEYEQVQPPPQVTQQGQAGEVSQAPPQLYAYPKKGQTAQQQATDKHECSSWASAQTGVNPATDASTTAPAAPADGKAGNANPVQGGVAGNANTPASAQQWQNYLRAESACLEARGYSVE